jgi:hypothetical protein
MSLQIIFRLKDMNKSGYENARKNYYVFSGSTELSRFLRLKHLNAIMHIYHASFTIAENLKFITLIVSENTRGQGTPLKIVKTSISDVIINVRKNLKFPINFKSISIIPENLTNIERRISENSPAQNL